MKKIILSSLIVLSMGLCGCISLVRDTKPSTESETKIEKDKDSDSSEKSKKSKKSKKKKDKDEWVSISEDKKDAPADLRAILVDEGGVSENEITDFLQDDFDGNGSEEAFALVGTRTDDYGDYALIEGSAWYVSESGAEKLSDSEAMGFNDKFRTMEMGDTTYVMFDEPYVTSTVTHVFYVSGNREREAAFSKCGLVITGLDGDGQFRIMDSSYDAMYDDEIGDMIGHTWKHYYFYYDDNLKKVCEYGGTDVTKEEAAKICKKDIVGELIESGDDILSMFVRGNGLLVINFQRPTDGGRDYFHFIYDITTGHLVDDEKADCDDEPLSGICSPALCPEIAEYINP